MRWLAGFAVVLLASAGEGPEFRLPPAGHSAADREPNQLIVTLAPGGIHVVSFLLRFRFDDGERDPTLGGVSLVEASGHVQRAGLEFHATEHAAGRSGYETDEKGARVLRLPVLLRIDRETPWLHVQWLLTVLREHKYFRFRIAVLRGDGEEAQIRADLRSEWMPEATEQLKAWGFLPRRAGDEPPDLWVHVLPTGYRIDDRHATDLDEAMRLIAEGSKPRTVCLRVGWKVPFGRVAAILDRLRALHLHRVWWFGLTELPLRVRAARPLPKPDKDWPGEDDLSIRPATYRRLGASSQ